MTRVRRLPRRVRAALVLVHVVASAGWLGLDGAMVALEVTGLHSGDPEVRAGIAVAIAILCWVLIPVVFTSLCTGLVLALGTSWGLARHWWLVGKAGIAVVLTATGVAMMLPRLDQVLAGEGEPVQVQTLAARSGALVLLFAATGLSVVKPWGKTRLAGSVGTQLTATARGAASNRAAANQRACRAAALDDILVRQGARSAQLHALRALDGRRVLRVASSEPGAAGGSLLVRGSRTWIETAASIDAATVVRARRQTAPGRTRPPRWSRSGTRPRA